jgi:hypothetical protein
MKAKPVGPQIDAIITMMRKRQERLFMRTTEKMHESIVWGSPLTGAPGQPVDTGDLKRSWQLTFPGSWLSRSASGLEYAPGIEAGMGKNGSLTLRSAVGGFHSRKLTRAGFQKLVNVSVIEILAGT